MKKIILLIFYMFAVCVHIISNNHVIKSDTTVLIDSRCGPADCSGIGSFDSGVFVSEGDSIFITAEGSFHNGYTDVPDANGFTNPPNPIYGVTILPSIASNSLVGWIDTLSDGKVLLDDGLDIHPETGETGSYYENPGIFGPGFVGTLFSCVVPSNVSGNIFFAINDTPLADNNGILTVTINVDKTTDIEENEDSGIKESDLIRNFPNPFTSSTKIQLAIKESGIVKITIYDLTGNEIETLIDEFRPRGKYEYEMDQTFVNQHLKPGIYICKLQSGNTFKSIKLIYIK